jgi:hypothetical protein
MPNHIGQKSFNYLRIVGLSAFALLVMVLVVTNMIIHLIELLGTTDSLIVIDYIELCARAFIILIFFYERTRAGLLIDSPAAAELDKEVRKLTMDKETSAKEWMEMWKDAKHN